MIKLYNTLSRKKEELHPIHPDWVGLYTCGPTVYNFAHIGNFRTYIFEDLLQRTLAYNGYAVRRVMNVTDVGHLTGDTDAGDDKFEKQAQAEKKSVEEIVKFYTDAFFADLEKLNVRKPDVVAPASEFVRQQIAMIQILLEKGYAYDTQNAVYFEVSRSKNYGALSGQSLEDKMTGARDEVVVDDEKHHPADFALWFKLVGKFKEHILHWPSPWGEGFPGWHIECSAISRHFLGQPFDIHAGGVDLIGTHHTNEIAQSEAAYDVPLANIWMHGEHLLIDNGKMGKSEGNFLTLGELIAKGYDPLIYRYLALGAHYRTPLNFTWESLDAAKNGLGGLYEKLYDISHSPAIAANDGDQRKASKFMGNFLEAINDDLNIPKALAVLYEMLDDPNIGTAEKIELAVTFDSVLGIDLLRAIEAEPGMEALEKAAEYETLRSNKQFIQSDALRKDIEALGYTVRDGANGSVLVKKFF